MEIYALGVLVLLEPPKISGFVPLILLCPFALFSCINIYWLFMS
jgi:hypothetical protein